MSNEINCEIQTKKTLFKRRKYSAMHNDKTNFNNIIENANF